MADHPDITVSIDLGTTFTGKIQATCTNMQQISLMDVFRRRMDDT